MFNLLAVLDILALLSRGWRRRRTVNEVDCYRNQGPKRRLLGEVYFYLKSNLPSLINDFDEGSDSVPGDGERKKKERERVVPGLFGPVPEERERERAEFQPRIGREGGFLCALFRAEVLTEGP